MRIYKDYYPEIILGDAIRGRAAAFKHPDVQWKQRLAEIRDAQAASAPDWGSGLPSGFRIARNTGRKKSVVPMVRTIRAQEVCGILLSLWLTLLNQSISTHSILTHHTTQDFVTLEEIDNVDAFVARMEHVELPSQLVAILADPLLQKLLLLRPDAEAAARIGNWLSAMLNDMACGDTDSGTAEDVLEHVAAYISQTKVG